MPNHCAVLQFNFSILQFTFYSSTSAIVRSTHEQTKSTFQLVIWVNTQISDFEIPSHVTVYTFSFYSSKKRENLKFDDSTYKYESSKFVDNRKLHILIQFKVFEMVREKPLPRWILSSRLVIGRSVGNGQVHLVISVTEIIPVVVADHFEE